VTKEHKNGIQGINPHVYFSDVLITMP